MPLDGVVVAVDDAPDRAVGLRPRRARAPTRARSIRAGSAPRRGPGGHGVEGEGGLTVARGGARRDVARARCTAGDGVGAHVGHRSAAIIRVKRTVSSQPWRRPRGPARRAGARRRPRAGRARRTASIASAPSPRQSWVSTSHPHSSSSWARGDLRVHGGLRAPRRAPAARADAEAPRAWPARVACRPRSRALTSVWRTCSLQCSSTAWPPARMAATSRGWAAARAR